MNNNAGRVFGYIAAAVLIVVLVVYGAVAIAKGSWDFANWNAAKSYQLAQKNQVRQNHLIQSNSMVQQGYQQAISQDVEAVVSDIAQMPGAPDGAALKTEAINAGDHACAEALKLDPSAYPVPHDMAAWIKANCSVGNLSPGSPIRSGKAS